MAAVKLDENVPDSLAAILATGGHDVALARDQRLTGVADDHLLAVASSEGRVLITLDRDFTNILRHPPGDTAGVVVIRLQDQTLSRLRQAAGMLRDLLVERQVRARLWVLDESKLRVWPRDSDE